MPWSRAFDDPIALDGRQLLTLKQAADYIMKLPEAEQNLPEWQAAIEGLDPVLSVGRVVCLWTPPKKR